MDIRIRSWTIEDQAELVQIINDKRVQDNLRDGIPYPYTLQDAGIFIREMITADQYCCFPFAIEAEGQVAGSISVVRKDNIHFRTGELGYYIGRNFWGKGIGTEAVKQICQYVFSNTDLIRIFAEPFACNKASCRILEKNGFQYEGTLRSNGIKNGQILDMKMYSLLKSDI